MDINDQPSHLDTQIISYAMKDRWHDAIDGCTISSIVANELFLVQSKNPAQANLYVPLLSTRHIVSPGNLTLRHRDRPFNKRLSDSIVMDFGNEYPTIIEYNSVSIANAINKGLDDLFLAAINHVGKREGKIIAARFRFLVDHRIRCIPLRRDDIESAFELLLQFRRKHNLKRCFRNSWNDMLVLSAARNARARLITEDSELARFASSDAGVSPLPLSEFIEIPFSRQPEEHVRSSGESKGYVNVGWRVQCHRRYRLPLNSDTP